MIKYSPQLLENLAEKGKERKGKERKRERERENG